MYKYQKTRRIVLDRDRRHTIPHHPFHIRVYRIHHRMDKEELQIRMRVTFRADENILPNIRNYKIGFERKKLHSQSCVTIFWIRNVSNASLAKPKPC